nr:MAG TPA: hypothetical protein [Caudoviricetes sp.]
MYSTRLFSGNEAFISRYTFDSLYTCFFIKRRLARYSL